MRRHTTRSNGREIVRHSRSRGSRMTSVNTIDRTTSPAVATAGEIMPSQVHSESRRPMWIAKNVTTNITLQYASTGSRTSAPSIA